MRHAAVHRHATCMLCDSHLAVAQASAACPCLCTALERGLPFAALLLILFCSMHLRVSQRRHAMHNAMLCCTAALMPAGPLTHRTAPPMLDRPSLQALFALSLLTYLLARINAVIRTQVALKAEWRAQPLLGATTAAVAAVLLTLLATRRQGIAGNLALRGTGTPSHLSDVLLAVVTADTLLRLLAVAAKVCAVLCAGDGSRACGADAECDGLPHCRHLFHLPHITSAGGAAAGHASGHASARPPQGPRAGMASGWVGGAAHAHSGLACVALRCACCAARPHPTILFAVVCLQRGALHRAVPLSAALSTVVDLLPARGSQCPVGSCPGGHVCPAQGEARRGARGEPLGGARRGAAWVRHGSHLGRSAGSGGHLPDLHGEQVAPAPRPWIRFTSTRKPACGEFAAHCACGRAAWHAGRLPRAYPPGVRPHFLLFLCGRVAAAGGNMSHVSSGGRAGAAAAGPGL